MLVAMICAASAICAISTEKALLLFKAVAFSQKNNTSILITKLGLSRRQFYSMMKKLIDTGLVRRTRGKYQLTSFGKVVFSAQAKVEIAINNYWNLKVLDSIMMSADKIHLPTEECQAIIDKLIGNDEVKTILVKKPD